jgi:non-specific serine/threonine protein kinase
MTTPLNSPHDMDALPIGTALMGYTVAGIIGRGGFGVVYVARDSRTERTVAVKEYLPSNIALRNAEGNVVPRSEQFSAAYERGLKSFLQEAERLAEFSHPALVEVHRAWEANGTAYMAMQYYPGKTLREVRLAATDGMSEAHIRRMVEPIFEALSELHAHRIIHRDVSPDNILVMPNGNTVLLDLGAARQVLGGMTQALTTILKPGFAPIEQYVDDGSMEQGRWTDVYGLAAVMYFLASGAPPISATSRLVRDVLPSLADVAQGYDYSIEMQTSVARALSLRAIERYKSMGEFRSALGWSVQTHASADEAGTLAVTTPSSDSETTQILAGFSAEEILRKTAPVNDVPSQAAVKDTALNKRAPPRAAANKQSASKQVSGLLLGMAIGLVISLFVIWKMFVD